MRAKIKDRILQCFVCHSVIKNKVSNLRRHIRLHYASARCFECLECHRKFQSKGNVRKHWGVKHSKTDSPRMIETFRELKSKQHSATLNVCERKMNATIGYN